MKSRRAPRPVVLRARFEAGQAREYELTRRREVVRASGPAGVGAARTRFRLAVVAVDRRGATLEWETLDVQAGGTQQRGEVARALGPDLANLMRGLRIRYRVSPEGRVRRLVDVELWQRRVDELLAQLVAPLPPEARAAVESVARGVALQPRLLRDVTLLHAPYGLSGVEGGERATPTRSRHPLGGVIPGVVIVALERRRAPRAAAPWVVRLDSLLDESALRRLVLRHTSRLAAVMGRALPERYDVRITHCEQGRFVLAPDSWPQRLRFQRTTFIETPIESGGQKETITIVRRRARREEKR